MARSITFKRQQILERAIALFWKQGYYATSVQDIVDHLDISRSSLYNTFGDKHTLFVEALKTYQHNAHRTLKETLQQEKPIKVILNEMFTFLIEELEVDTTNKGCFMVNTTTEMAALDPEICALVSENREKVEAVFREALRKAEENGELPAHLNPEALARYFFNVYNGLRVVVKTNPGRKALQDVVDVSLSVLDKSSGDLL
ncbi:MAG: TetR/AcrR family transcriptional regulator [Balneolaceae bacterium]|nr:TetR/AcrR family transcriptional regulator [Balneolaceae bacterium]